MVYKARVKTKALPHIVVHYKGLVYFNHILITSVAILLCVWHMKFKKCLEFKSEWSFFLLNQFIYMYKSSCLVRVHVCFNLTHLPMMEFLVAWLRKKCLECSQIGVNSRRSTTLEFQENLFSSIPWSHWWDWDNLKCGWSNLRVFTVYSLVQGSC